MRPFIPHGGWVVRGKHSAWATTAALGGCGTLHLCGRTRTPFITEGESMPRKQTKRVTIQLTPKEYNTLMWKRIEAAGVTWREFIFKMCTEGKIVSNDALRELNKELRYQGNNLNQLTRLAHQGQVNVVDLTELRKLYERLLDTIIERGE